MWTIRFHLQEILSKGKRGFIYPFITIIRHTYYLRTYGFLAYMLRTAFLLVDMSFFTVFFSSFRYYFDFLHFNRRSSTSQEVDASFLHSILPKAHIVEFYTRYVVVRLSENSNSSRNLAMVFELINQQSYQGEYLRRNFTSLLFTCSLVTFSWKE